ncbi:MAG TPA: CdaR family protein [Methylomirabilota bacterium]|nr:CdaR family protein [Methylomirabilota bacterium]
MTRVIGVLVHNWPLKLAAVGLATLLYGGLVFSQSSQPFDGVIPVDVRGQADDTFLLTQPDPVTTIRYLAPSGVRPITSTFEAWIDLEGIDPGSGPRSVPVHVRSIDNRITVIGSEPDRVTIDLDKLATRRVPVAVPKVAAPENMELGPTTFSPTQVQISGPASVLARVIEARANVLIQSGIDVDQEVNLVPVDALGDAVGQVNVTPATARVTIPVFSNKESKTLTISPLVTGDPAPGFELVGATAEPQVVTVEGDIDDLQPLLSVDTAPVPIGGISANQTLETTLALPTGVVALDVQTVRVSIVLRPVTATRSFQVGLSLVGARPDRIYSLSTDRVILTVGGSIADLDRLEGAAIVATLDVADVATGTAAITVDADLPAGVAFVSASPEKVSVTVATPPPATPSTAPPGTVSPSPSPGG